MWNAPAHMVGSHSPGEILAGECLACTRCGGAAHLAGHLSPALRRQALAALRSRLRHAVGRGQADPLACPSAHHSGDCADRRYIFGESPDSRQKLPSIRDGAVWTDTGGYPDPARTAYLAGDGHFLSVGVSRSEEHTSELQSRQYL